MTKRQAIHLVGVIVSWSLLPAASLCTLAVYLISQVMMGLCESAIGSLSQLLTPDASICVQAQGWQTFFLLALTSCFVLLVCALVASMSFIDCSSQGGANANRYQPAP